MNRESYEERLAEEAQDYSDGAAEDFARWAITDDGLEAFKEFGRAVVGVPGSVEELDNARMEVLFNYVVSQGGIHLSNWLGYYVEKRNDYEGQRGDFLHDQERDQ